MATYCRVSAGTSTQFRLTCVSALHYLHCLAECATGLHLLPHSLSDAPTPEPVCAVVRSPRAYIVCSELFGSFRICTGSDVRMLKKNLKRNAKDTCIIIFATFCDGVWHMLARARSTAKKCLTQWHGGVKTVHVCYIKGIAVEISATESEGRCTKCGNMGPASSFELTLATKLYGGRLGEINRLQLPIAELKLTQELPEKRLGLVGQHNTKKRGYNKSDDSITKKGFQFVSILFLSYAHAGNKGSFCSYWSGQPPSACFFPALILLRLWCLKHVPNHLAKTCHAYILGQDLYKNCVFPHPGYPNKSEPKNIL